MPENKKKKFISDRKMDELADFLVGHANAGKILLCFYYFRDNGFSRPTAWSNTGKIGELWDDLKSSLDGDLAKGILELLPKNSGAYLRRILLSRIEDVDYLKSYYSRTLSEEEKKGIVEALWGDSSFIEMMLSENNLSVFYDMVEDCVDVGRLEMLREYANGHYRTYLNKRIKGLPKSVGYVQKLRRGERYVESPELVGEFVGMLREKLGERDWDAFEGLLSRVKLTNGDREILRGLLDG